MKLRIQVGRSQGCAIKSNLQEVCYENPTEMKEVYSYYYYYHGQEKATPPKKNP